MPHVCIRKNDITGFPQTDLLIGMGGIGVIKYLLGNLSRAMSTGHKTRGTVVWGEVVQHPDRIEH